MKYKYNGTDERVFPGVKVTVKPGDEFDAPEGFTAANVVPAAHKTFIAEPKEVKEVKEIKENKSIPSAASDRKLGDE